MTHWKMAVLGLGLMSRWAYAAQDPDDARARAGATYVFVGTVTASREEKAGEGLEVTVEETLFQKGVFDDQTGRNVIVFGAPASLTAGDRRVFYTNPVQFGRTIAVNYVAARAASDQESVSSLGNEARDSFERREIRERVDLADVVVSGRVTEVRSLSRAAQRDGEHFPDFHVAVVEVERVLKGGVTTATLEFVFAASRDVQWFRAPKFQAGDDGVFLLNAAAEQHEEALAPVREEYSLLHELDFQPRDNFSLVESVLR